MPEHKKKREAGEPEPLPSGSPRKQPTYRVIPGELGEAPSERRPPKIRIVGEERLTPQELKKRFASNLDLLIDIIGLNRKEAAQEIGVPYKLLRRLVSAGVSCTDERNIDGLTKIVTYFSLPGVDHLWQAQLLIRLLGKKEGEGKQFVTKFRLRLEAARETRLAGDRPLPRDLFLLLGGALGVEPLLPPGPAIDPYPQRVAAILASTRGENFKRIIDDYYELVTVPNPKQRTHDSSTIPREQTS